MQKSIFISYAHKDAKEFAEKLRSHLIMAGHRAFFDNESIIPGTPWQQSIDDAIVRADYFLPILTPQSIISEPCQQEVSLALEKNKQTIPLLRLECAIPENLAHIQYIDFTDDEMFDSKCERLLHTIAMRVIKPDASTPWLQQPVVDFAIHTSGSQPLYCITENTSLAKAYSMMYKSDFVFRHLLVTADGNPGSPLRGILSLRHILKRMIQSEDLRGLKTKEVMDVYDRQDVADRYFVVVNDNDVMETALRKFVKRLERRKATGRYYYMSAIPLVGKNSNATGIISFKDVLRGLGNTTSIPDRTVGQVMRKFEQISTSLYNESFDEANLALLQFGPGQRDVPIIDNRSTRKLLGLVPDHIFITNLNSDQSVGSFMVEYSKLKIHYLNMPLRRALNQYLSGEAATIFYSFPVVTSEDEPRLEGLIGYRDIFGALLPGHV